MHDARDAKPRNIVLCPVNFSTLIGFIPANSKHLEIFSQRMVCIKCMPLLSILQFPQELQGRTSCWVYLETDGTNSQLSL
jgi:hypothetical protein